MASYPNKPDDEEQDPNAPPAPAAVPPAPGVTPPPTSTAATPPASPGVPQRRKSGTPSNFIAFDKYLSANKPELAGVANRLTQQAQQAAQTAQQSAERENQAQAQAAQGGFWGPTTTTSIGPNGETVYTTNPGTYRGPEQFQYSSGTQAQLAAAQQAAANISTPGGLEAYYRTQGGNPARSAFNAALTGAAGGQQFQQAGQQFAGLDQRLSQQQAAGNAQIEAQKAQLAKDNAAAADKAATETQKSKDYQAYLKSEQDRKNQEAEGARIRANRAKRDSEWQGGTGMDYMINNEIGKDIYAQLSDSEVAAMHKALDAIGIGGAVGLGNRSRWNNFVRMAKEKYGRK